MLVDELEQTSEDPTKRADQFPELKDFCRLREPDRLILSLLLMKAGLKASAIKEFRVYRSPAEL